MFEILNFDLATILGEASDLIGLRVAEKHLEYYFSIEPDVPLLLKVRRASR